MMLLIIFDNCFSSVIFPADFASLKGLKDLGINFLKISFAFNGVILLSIINSNNSITCSGLMSMSLSSKVFLL